MAKGRGGNGPKNLAKTMSPKSGRVSGGHSMKPKQPAKLNIQGLRGKTNPTKAS